MSAHRHTQATQLELKFSLGLCLDKADLPANPCKEQVIQIFAFPVFHRFLTDQRLDNACELPLKPRDQVSSDPLFGL